MAERVRLECRTILTLLLLTVPLCPLACRRSEPTPTPEPQLDMSETVPVQGEAKGYLHKVVRTQPLAQVELGIISVEQSVAAFNAIHGRLPNSLDELQADGYSLPELPRGKAFRYLPGTGKVWVADVPKEPRTSPAP